MRQLRETGNNDLDPSNPGVAEVIGRAKQAEDSVLNLEEKRRKIERTNLLVVSLERIVDSNDSIISSFCVNSLTNLYKCNGLIIRD